MRSKKDRKREKILCKCERTEKCNRQSLSEAVEEKWLGFMVAMYICMLIYRLGYIYVGIIIYTKVEEGAVLRR